MSRHVALLGAGYWGKNLARVLHELGALRVLCDPSPEAQARGRALGGDISVTADVSAVLADPAVQAVVIATPAATHAALVAQALEHGKDVLVEKPLALTLPDGRRLVDLAQQHRRLLMVGHILEYHPAIVKLKSLVDEGALGRIQYVYSNRLNLGKFRTEENILWSFAPHDISVIRLLLDESPVEVTAQGAGYLHPHVADVTMTTMRFASGARAHIFVSWLHPTKEQRLVVVGDRRMAVFNDTAERDKLVLYAHEIDWVHRVPVPHAKDGEVIAIELAEPLKAECEHFLECVSTRKAPRTDGLNGLRVLEILQAAEASLAQGGRPVSLGTGPAAPVIHPSALVEEPGAVGQGTRIWHFSHVMNGARIGRDCVLGQNVFVASGVVIGDRVKIQNNVSVYAGVTLEDEVFCGPSMVFTNVNTPRSGVSRKDAYEPTLVRHGATLGANCTVVCGVTIGRYAFVGAGAVVTRDIPDYGLVWGSPAQLQGWMCRCGLRLEFKGAGAACRCGASYRNHNGRIAAEAKRPAGVS